MSDHVTVEVNDVIQIDPEQADSFFRGCFAIVMEVKGWGVQAFVAIPESRGEMPGQVYVRVPWSEFEVIGKAVWAPGPDVEGETE